MGLVISQRLAEMLGGRINAQSTEGQGSTFTLSIPIGDSDESTSVFSADSAREENRADFVNMEIDLSESFKLSCRVLIVDDRRDIRFISSHILTQAGATVDECEDGLRALDFVAQSSDQGNWPDLILLDMQMPNLDGYATAKGLREHGFKGPIIALTADAMQSDMKKCIAAGCDDYLSKPINRSLLLGKVASWTNAIKTNLSTRE